MKIACSKVMLCVMGLFTINTTFAATEVVYVLSFPEVKKQEKKYLAMQKPAVPHENKTNQPQ